MPFTPIHLGPGLLLKAIGGRRFSFMVFGGSQVLMDIEPLIGILQDKPILHGSTHTVLGALVIGCIAAAVGKPISSFALKHLEIPHQPLTWPAVLTGAFAGTYSHVLLDGIMHSDMSPLWPFSPSNPLLGLTSIELLHSACFAAGVVGLVGLAARAIFMRRD